MGSSPIVLVLLFLLLLLCLPFAIRWAQQRFQLGMPEVSGQAKFISAVAVGPNQKVVTVEVGPTGNRYWLTVGVTPQAVHCLHTLPVGAEVTSVVSPSPLAREASHGG